MAEKPDDGVKIIDLLVDTELSETDKLLIDELFHNTDPATIKVATEASCWIVEKADAVMKAVYEVVSEDDNDLDGETTRKVALLVLMGIGSRLRTWPYKKQLQALKFFIASVSGNIPEMVDPDPASGSMEVSGNITRIRHRLTDPRLPPRRPARPGRGYQN